MIQYHVKAPTGPRLYAKPVDLGLASSAFLETVEGATLRKLASGKWFPALDRLVLFYDWPGEPIAKL